MKKRDKNVVVQFPGLKDRLLELGLEHLEEKHYSEAIHYLGQAHDLEPDHPEIGTALLLALYESGDYINAKNQCTILLNKGIGEYFEIIDVLLMILIQLGEHSQVVQTINALLDEGEVPLDKKEHYEKLLQFSQKRDGKQNVTENIEDEFVMSESLFSTSNITEQILRIAQLANQNIQPYLDELTNYLMDSTNHPFVQTMVINVLKEHGIEKKQEIRKFQFKKKVIPNALNKVFETPFYLSLIEEIRTRLENENPSLFEQIKVIADRHFFLLYPFELKPEDTLLWCTAYICLGSQLYGDNIKIDSIAQQYDVDHTSLVKALDFIHKLEEISLPIL